VRGIAVRPNLFRADLDAGSGANDNYCPLTDPDCGFNLADKVGVTGGVHQVNFISLPDIWEHTEADTHASFLLGRVVIGGRAAFADLPQSINYFGVEQDGFRQRSLACTVVSEQSKVSDVFKPILRHITNPLYVTILLTIIAVADKYSKLMPEKRGIEAGIAGKDSHLMYNVQYY